MKTSISSVLIGVGLLLAVVLAYLWSDPARYSWEAPAALAPDAQTFKPASQPASPIDLGRFRETVERPLFAADRRPPPPEQKAGEPAVAAADGLAGARLLALIDAGGKRGSAVVVAEGKIRRVRFGEKLGKWTLERAEGRQAIFVADGETRTLALERAWGLAAAAADPSAGGAPVAERPAPERPAAAPARPGGMKTAQDRVRERIARNNVLRIQNGLPPEPMPQ